MCNINKNLVSVIIPTYNSESFIEETVKSVINQTYTNWELIIVDDGSNDNTKNKIKSFLNNEKIKYVYQENKGVSSARNLGIKLSKGEFIAFLDSDDIWDINNLSEKVRYLIEHRDVLLVHANVQVIDEKSTLMPIIYEGSEGGLLNDLLLWEKCCIPGPSSILIRREVINKVGIWDETLSTAADQDFFIRISTITMIGKIPKILSFYRIHNRNMHSNIKLMEKEHIIVYKKALNNKLFYSQIFTLRCFSNLYLILAGCWWVNANNKIKALKYIIFSIFMYPINTKKLIYKLIKKLLKWNEKRTETY